MERESLKDAAAKKIQFEDITTSARLRILLGCGKDLSRGGKNLNEAGKTKIIHERTPVQPSRPEILLHKNECIYIYDWFIFLKSTVIHLCRLSFTIMLV